MLKYRFQINSNSIKGGRIIRCKGIESNFHYTRVRFMQGWARVRHFSIHQKYVLQTQVFYICSILANKNILKSELQHWKSRYQELIFMLCRSHLANIVFLIDIIHSRECIDTEFLLDTFTTPSLIPSVSRTQFFSYQRMLTTKISVKVNISIYCLVPI